MMRDRDVRLVLHRKLDAEHQGDADTRILHELGLRHGTRRVDIAVLNGSLHGYEIKSDSDTLDRLPGQVEAYAAVLDYATLVVGERLAGHARKKLPKWWGVEVASIDATGEVSLQPHRPARFNPKINPIALAELLWRSEAIELLAGHGVSSKILRMPRAVLYRELALNLCLDELREAVQSRLKMRTAWRDQTRPSSDGGSLQPIPRC
jgi:hypothetical protein